MNWATKCAYPLVISETSEKALANMLLSNLIKLGLGQSAVTWVESVLARSHKGCTISQTSGYILA